MQEYTWTVRIYTETLTAINCMYIRDGKCIIDEFLYIKEGKSAGSTKDSYVFIQENYIKAYALPVQCHHLASTCNPNYIIMDKDQ